MPPMVTWSFVAVVLLASVHLLGARLRFLDVVPRSRWLSAAGGVSVAYVFVHLLPELAEHQEVVEAASGGLFGFLSHHVYLLAMAGLVVFYCLERVVGGHVEALPDGVETTPGIYRLHLGAFAGYNLLVGYLLVRWEDPDLRGLVLYTVAMALHFVVVDWGLRADHSDTYRLSGRWLLAGAAVAGWFLGSFTRVPDSGVALVASFLAGAVVLNVLKEELPEDRESRTLPFLVGVVGYGALLLLV